MRLYETMRRHRAGLLHPLRRPDLRRQPDRGRGQARRRHGLEEPDDAGQGEGRRDARRVPRQLRLQPARREHPPLQRRGAVRSCSGTTTRRATTGTRASSLDDERYRGQERLAAGRATRERRSSNTTRCGSTPSDPERIYRSSRLRPVLDVFMLDERSYRGPNTPNRQTALDDGVGLPGRGAARAG